MSVNRTQVIKAIKALKEYKEKKATTSKKMELIENEDYIYVTASLYRIPIQKNTLPIPIAVPHPIYNEFNEGCIIINGSKPQLKEYRDQHKGEFPTSLKKIYTSTRVANEFKSFESRRKLVNSYDYFLIDKKIYSKAAGLLGVEAFKKKKIPIPVNMKAENLCAELQKACSKQTYLRYAQGPTISVRAAKLDFDDEAMMADNILSVCDAITKLPEIGATADGDNNIQTFFLFIKDALFLPIFYGRHNLKRPLVEVPEIKEAEEEKVEEEKEAEVAPEVPEAPEEEEEEEEEEIAKEPPKKTPKKAETPKKTPKKAETPKKTPKKKEVEPIKMEVEEEEKKAETPKKTPKKVETPKKTPKNTPVKAKTPKKAEEAKVEEVPMETVEEAPVKAETPKKTPKKTPVKAKTPKKPEEPKVEEEEEKKVEEEKKTPMKAKTPKKKVEIVEPEQQKTPYTTPPPPKVESINDKTLPPRSARKAADEKIREISQTPMKRSGPKTPAKTPKTPKAAGATKTPAKTPKTASKAPKTPKSAKK